MCFLADKTFWELSIIQNEIMTFFFSICYFISSSQYWTYITYRHLSILLKHFMLIIVY